QNFSGGNRSRCLAYATLEGGTRVPVQTHFDYLQGKKTLEDFLEGFPTVSRESAVAALQEAKLLLLARP
ncbi:MAG: DUF433 domain-containing protein, partial [Candidatus Acidiferrum sp.]